MNTGTTPFSLDEEYEGGHFGADGEFYYNQKKQGKKFTKNDQIYGIFNDEAGSSDEDPKKSKKGSAPTVQPTMSKNYLGFVKSEKVLYNPEAGKVRVNLGKKKTAELAAAEKAKILEEVTAHANETKKQKKSVRFNEGRNEEMIFDKNEPVGSSMPDFISSGDEAPGMEEEEDEDFISSKINQEVLRRKGKFDFKKPASSHQKVDDYGLPTTLGKRRAPVIVEPKAAAKANKDGIKEAALEENYGKGWKMMQSLGYKVNTGLGSKEQGRLDPIMAVKKTVLDGKRAEKITSKQSAGLAADLMQDLEEEEMEPIEEEEKPKLWKKGKARNQMNYLRKTNHVRPADITVPETELIKPVIQQKVVDMRGPQVMYFEDYNAMKNLDQGKVGTTTARSAAKPAFLSEMLLTLKGHVDKTKYNIQSSERKMRIERDKIINFNYEKTQLEQDQKRLDKDIENLKVLKTRLNQFATQSTTLNDQETLDLFRDCFEATPTQFTHLKLDHLFINTIAKKLQASVSNWVIKESTLDEHFDIFVDVKDFLIRILKFKEYLKYKAYTDKSIESVFSPDSSYDETLLEKYLSEIFNRSWLAPLRSYILNEWNPKDPDILILLVEKWKPIVPVLVLSQLYDTVIMQKLQNAVDTWTPTSDRMPVHIWLHPWFPLLGEKRLETLWKSIQMKLSQLLMQWEPQDKSALVLLKPWLRVFERSSWENLIDRCILPKLMYGLRDFEVNPKKQKVDPVRWLIDWAGYLSQENLVSILENSVLRKIVEVGMEWISSPNSKLEEIKVWLDGWKELLGPKVMSIPTVQHYFKSLEGVMKK